MDRSELFALRKQNLNRIMLDKFQGNRAALARASGVHPNHVNLILSNNEAHRRNLGEALARKIEDQLGLPARWLDSPHDGMATELPASVGAPPIHETLRGALRSCEEISGLTTSAPQAAALFRRVTAVENLIIATVDTADMAPEISDGDTVIVDTAAKAISGDGIYIFTRGTGAPMLRRVGRSVTGETTVSAGAEQPVVMTASALKSLKVVGRLVASLRFSRL